MSNLKHTPAPWYQYGDLIVDANRHSVCELLPKFDLDDATKEGIEYNAKLIASAPELLEALILANKLITGFVPAEGDDHMKIKNAIKKATEL